MQEALLTSAVANAICPGEDLVNESLLTRIREAGLECYVWTVNDPNVVRALLETGIDGIITDDPRLLARTL